MCLVISSRHVSDIKYHGAGTSLGRRENSVPLEERNCSVEDKHYYNLVGVMTEGGRAKIRPKPTEGEGRRKYIPTPFVN